MLLASLFIIPRGDSYHVSTDRYDGEKISICYPVIDFGNHKEKTELVNRQIYDFLNQICSEEEIALGLDYFIPYEASDYISICFWGIQYPGEDEYIKNVCIPLTINLDTATTSKIEDFLGKEDLLKIEADVVNGMYERSFGNMDMDSARLKLAYQDAVEQEKWYLTQGGIGFVMDGLPFKEGSYARIKVSYNADK